ncbi:hypothetical protein KI387_008322, partial [Taxus chinensis]
HNKPRVRGLDPRLSVESTGGHRALRQDQGEATSSRRLALGDAPVGTQPPPMMGGEMLAGRQTGAEEAEGT